MNQDHAIAGVGGVSTTAMLATVLTHLQGIDTATASAEAGLIVLALGAVIGVIQNCIVPRKTVPPPAPGIDHPPPGSPAANP